MFTWKDGTVMFQTQAIMRALGMEYGYYPTDPMQMWLVDSSMDAINEVFTKCANIYFSPTDGAKADALKQYLEVHFPAFLKVMNTRLNGRVYLTGKLSIGDITLGAFLSCHAFNPANPHQKMFESVLKQFKNVDAFYTNFAKDHAQHLKERPASFF